MLNEKAKLELSPKDQKFLSELIGRGVERLIPAEKAHIVARRDYISDETLKKIDIDSLADEAGENSEQVSSYASMTVPELKELCKDRGIEGATKKAEMVEALEKDDKGELDEEVEEEVED